MCVHVCVSVCSVSVCGNNYEVSFLVGDERRCSDGEYDYVAKTVIILP